MSVIHQAMLMSSIGIWASAPIPDGSAPPASAASYFTNILTGGGGATYTLCGASWPSGLSINAATGVISGTGAAGTYTGLQICLFLPDGRSVRSNPFTLTLTGPYTRLFASQSGGAHIWYSDDFAATWVDLGVVTSYSGIYLSKVGDLLFGTSNNTPFTYAIYRSADNGASWSNYTPSGTAARERVSGPVGGKLIVFDTMAVSGTRSQVELSTDAGLSFSVTTPFSASATAPRTAALKWCFDRYIYLSSSLDTNANAGATSSDGLAWTTFTRPATSGANYVDSVYRFNGLFILFSATASTPTYYTTTDFVTFTARTFPVNATIQFDGHGVVSPDGSAFLVQRFNGPVYRSTNGTSWSLVLTPVGSSGRLTTAGSRMYLMSSSGATIYVSADQGATWAAPITLPFAAFTLPLVD